MDARAHPRCAQFNRSIKTNQPYRYEFYTIYCTNMRDVNNTSIYIISIFMFFLLEFTTCKSSFYLKRQLHTYVGVGFLKIFLCSLMYLQTIHQSNCRIKKKALSRIFAHLTMGRCWLRFLPVTNQSIKTNL